LCDRATQIDHHLSRDTAGDADNVDITSSAATVQRDTSVCITSDDDDAVDLTASFKAVSQQCAVVVVSFAAVLDREYLALEQFATSYQEIVETWKGFYI